jgi:hypothetical protein
MIIQQLCMQRTNNRGFTGKKDARRVGACGHAKHISIVAVEEPGFTRS